MKLSQLLVVILLNFGAVLAQNSFPLNPDPIDNISKEITRMSKSLEQLNERLKSFTKTFSSNQGLKLSERQQRLLAAFEYLNRAEQRLATLQLLKINLNEKQSTVKLKLAEIEDGLRAESVDRSVALRGTTNAEELRSIRRQLLSREKSDLTVLLGEIQNTVSETDYEIRRTEKFLKRIRQRIFPEIEKEISDLQ